MRMTEGLDNVKNTVEFLLKKYPITRDSDKILWLGFLNIKLDLKARILKCASGEEAYEVFKEVLMDEDTPTMESVRRTRQKFQQEGKYHGESRQERMEESNKVRDWARS
jgi:hypothetical protein